MAPTSDAPSTTGPGSATGNIYTLDEATLGVPPVDGSDPLPLGSFLPSPMGDIAFLDMLPTDDDFLADQWYFETVDDNALLGMLPLNGTNIPAHDPTTLHYPGHDNAPSPLRTIPIFNEDDIGTALLTEPSFPMSTDDNAPQLSS